jgi:hypothetical protein
MSAETECVCGGTIREVVLPSDIARYANRATLWIHVSTWDTRCYPDDKAADVVTAEPYDNAVHVNRPTPITPITTSAGDTGARD